MKTRSAAFPALKIAPTATRERISQAHVKCGYAATPLGRRDRHPRCAPEQPQESLARAAAERARRRHRRLRLGKVLARLRHALRGRAAALRRDFQPVRAAVPRPHGQAAGGRDRGDSPRDRDRPDQSRAHIALDRGHDDRAERSPEAALRARGAALLPRLRTSGAPGLACLCIRAAVGPRQGRGRSAIGAHLPRDGAEEFQGGGSALAPQGPGLRPHPRAPRQRARGRAGPAAHVSGRQDARGRRHRGRPQDRAGQGQRLSSRRRGRRRSALALFLGPSLPGLRHSLLGADSRAVLVQFTPRTLREGAVRPWQSPAWSECQDDLEKYAKKRGVPLDVSWRALPEAQRKWVLEGEPEWVSWRKSWPGTWYGVARFFRWLETKAYKMHVRVLLSRYRAYTPCSACNGARLKPGALLWRVGTKEDADRVLDPTRRFMPQGSKISDDVLRALPGLTVHDLVLLPAERTRAFFEHLHLPAPLDEATDLLLTEIRARLRYVCEVGLGYLTLDRQSRTLSGGEVQRINLTTALGTSLVNTLFVLDEPSIGLHPRDMGRVIGVMQRLRDAGNSLVVVEHDPQIMLQADRILDMGPGPGERGGEIVFFGAPEALKAAKTITAEYLSGRRRADGTTLTLPSPASGRGSERSEGAREFLEILGAAEHNLKNIDVAVPLGRLVCITGVSGSGKSTLVQDVLYPALLKAKGRPTEAPGNFRGLKGHGLLEDVVMVDQTPIGRTTRSNPASYVGAWNAIRDIYAKEPLARERKYTAGTFSFNSGNGRCPSCGGN